MFQHLRRGSRVILWSSQTWRRAAWPTGTAVWGMLHQFYNETSNIRLEWLKRSLYWPFRGIHVSRETVKFWYLKVHSYTVEPVFSGPRDERPPAMYGQCSDVPITFQRKYPWDERPPGGRGRGRGQRFFVIFHLLGRTVNFILINIFQ